MFLKCLRLINIRFWMELSFNFIAVIFITIRALAKSKIITYVRGKLKNLHDEIKCFSIIVFTTDYYSIFYR